MGNFSRDPELRLADAETKHYVGHRVQQGVPLLDADLHLIDGLRRRELESIGQWMLGDGVPVGSDGFRVSALAGGGLNTLVLRSATAAAGPSTLTVDLAASTAAGALGFDATNAAATRFGDSPAQLTSRAAQPFVLAAGLTLTLVADGGAPETATFQPADFAAIGAATAVEVAAAINAAMARATAAAGTGADFRISGGDGTTAGAGRLLVEGRFVLVERSLLYSEQPLYLNAALAAAWGVAPVAALPTPIVNETQTVYVDVWHREIDATEDPLLVDGRIGIETAVSVRREWAVRAVAASQYAATRAARPAGHAFYPLAELRRGANDPAVRPAMVSDLRDTDASLRPEVAYRNAAGTVTVDTLRVRDMLAATRDGARDFITYLTATFVAPATPYTAAEIAGIETLSAVASAADHALGAIHARSLGTRGALGAMRQLYDAERRFVTTWQAIVLPLVIGGQAKYNAAFASSLLTIRGYLDGPAPGGLIAIATALGAGDLEGAVASQERIAAELAAQSGRPIGAITLTYLGSVAPTVVRNTPIDLRYEVAGSVTPDDDLLVDVFINPGWTVSLKNGDGSTPFALRGGPGAFTRQFIVTVTPPDVPAAQTQFSVEARAKKNPAGVDFITTQKSLQIGAAPPASENQYAITHFSTVPESAGVLQVPRGTTAQVAFRIQNKTGVGIVANLDPTAAAGGWTVTKGPFTLANQPIAAVSSADFGWQFTAPATAGAQLVFTLRVRDQTNLATVFADATITLVSI